MASTNLTRAFKRAVYTSPRLHEVLLAVKIRLRPIETGMHLGDSPEAVFSEIYERNGWGNDESVSGGGSTVAYTANLRAKLPELLRSYDVRTFLDAPCGDMVWMREVDLPAQVTYLGADIVPALVERLQSTLAADNRQFLRLDVVNDRLPAADLWMCRDCLIHLPNADVFRALENFANSDISYLLTTTYNYPPNVDIPLGQFRAINLRRPPFCLPKPLRTIIDYVPPWPPRRLALYSREQIRGWVNASN